MQPDQILFAVSGAVTFGWYAALHFGLGLF